MKINPYDDYFRCDNENCDYDVCPRCGMVAGMEATDNDFGGDEVSAVQSFSQRCPQGNLMKFNK